MHKVQAQVSPDWSVSAGPEGRALSGSSLQTRAKPSLTEAASGLLPTLVLLLSFKTDFMYAFPLRP